MPLKETKLNHLQTEFVIIILLLSFIKMEMKVRKHTENTTYSSNIDYSATYLSPGLAGALESEFKLMPKWDAIC